MRSTVLIALLAVFTGGTAVLAADTDAEARAAVIAAAAELGCTVRDPARDVKRLNVPLDGIFQVRCADTHIIWFHQVDGAWTLRPLG